MSSASPELATSHDSWAFSSLPVLSCFSFPLQLAT